ncbi:MAG: hypothetical protein IPM48_13420 [Saprospiraceae bacterium]|nr:hypothetical protein [Saprospiraceae bacterium]
MKPTNEGKLKFYEILAGVIEKSNTPGFDYIEFKSAVKSVAEMHQMNEETAYKTAFITAQTMNVKASFLIDSAKKYISILNTEEIAFSQSAQKYLDQQIQGRKNELGQLEKETQDIKAEIQRLQQVLIEKEKRINKISEEADSFKQKYESNKVDFQEAYKTIVQQIEEDIQKMQKYLA